MSNQAAANYLDREIVVEIDSDGTLRERDVSDCTVEQMVKDIVSGEARDPAHIISFNPTEGISRDVSEDVARAALALFASKETELNGWDDVPAFLTSQIAEEVEDAKAAWVLEDVAETTAINEARSDFCSRVLFPRVQVSRPGVRA